MQVIIDFTSCYRNDDDVGLKKIRFFKKWMKTKHTYSAFLKISLINIDSNLKLKKCCWIIEIFYYNSSFIILYNYNTCFTIWIGSYSLFISIYNISPTESLFSCRVHKNIKCLNINSCSVFCENSRLNEAISWELYLSSSGRCIASETRLVQGHTYTQVSHTGGSEIPLWY